MDLKLILKKHLDWLVDNTGGARANLSGADLSGADLYGANLSGAYLSGAYLSGANLYGAYLYGADLSGANLYGANLYGANLYGANLYGANLSSANLSSANLYGADLSGADLSGANLYGANLSATQISAILPTRSICPQEGAFRGYKKVLTKNGDPVVLVLLITKSSARLGGMIGRKCRASRVKVLSAEAIDGTPINTGEVFISKHDMTFTYAVGKIIETEFDPNPMEECTKGIHFFISKQEAKEY